MNVDVMDVNVNVLGRRSTLVCRLAMRLADQLLGLGLGLGLRARVRVRAGVGVRAEGWGYN